MFSAGSDTRTRKQALSMNAICVAGFFIDMMDDMKYAERYQYDDSMLNIRGASSRKTRAYIHRARKEALKSNCSMSIGAIIVKGGSIVSYGYNKTRNNTSVFGNNNPNDSYLAGASTHAEIDALSQVKDAQGASIYIVRVAKDGTNKLAKPCIDCAQALSDAGIAKIFVHSMEEIDVLHKGELMFGQRGTNDYDLLLAS